MNGLATWKELKFGLKLVPYSRQYFEKLGRMGLAPVRRKFRNRTVWVIVEVVEWQQRFQPVQPTGSSA